jgi:hypothetical protein
MGEFLVLVVACTDVGYEVSKPFLRSPEEVMFNAMHLLEDFSCQMQ